LCREKKEGLAIAEEDYAPAQKKTKASEARRKELDQKLQDYRSWLLGLTICDPACGSGAFLNAALEFLIAEHSYIDELTNKLTGHGTLEFKWTPNDILEHNLFGVDINEEAVEIARLSLWLRTAQKGRKLSNLSRNIKVGNSLIDDKTVAGEKAFNWKEEFKEVFDKGGFDVVIGNPPYVRPRSFVEKELKFLKKQFIVGENQLDLYPLFIEATRDLSNHDALISFIVPNAFLANENSKCLRSFILDNYNILSISECKKEVFADADVESLVFVFSKNKNSSSAKFFLLEKKEFIFKNEFDQEGFRANKNQNFIVTLDSKSINLFAKIKTSSNCFSDYFDIITGIKEYQVGKGSPPQSQLDKDTLRFNADYKKDETFQPELRGKNVLRYGVNWTNEYVSYGPWIAEPRGSKFFEGEKILVRQIPSSKSLIAGYTEQNFIIDQSAFIAKRKAGGQINLKFALALLNSKLLFWFFQNENNEFDELFPKIKSKEFKALPIPERSEVQQQPFIAKADIMLSKNGELHNLKQSLLQFVKAKHEGITPSKKLAGWPQLSFKEFLKELEKQKVKLSLAEQAEWLPYFEEQKRKALELQNLIHQTDKEIDAMVYALYGLTEEEIKIVEG